MPTPPNIRPATTDDLDVLARFNEAMAKETENKTLDPDTIRNGIQTMLNEQRQGFYRVAERDDRVVGSLMITTEWSDWRNATFWWIQSVYVRPDARRTGVYTALHRHVQKEAANKEEVCGLRLYVERGNTSARDTYEHLGMTETSYRMYEKML